MTTVKVSSKYQVVIPRDVRESVGIHVGETCQMIPYENRIELIPVRPMRRMRGFLKGIDTSVPRERDRV
jgi:AbrB family looped-hinge helix DNA binding protein